MKSIILFAEIGTTILLIRLCSHFKFASRKALFYILNPLVIVELCGNLHFEAVMIFFLLLSLYLMVKNKNLFSAVAFGLAVGTKLWPLMFLPFLIKRIGWQKTFIFGLITITTVVIIFIPFYEPAVPQNFFNSIRLYFQNFEFNASLYFLARWIGYEITGYNIIQTTGKIFPVIVGFFSC